MRRNAQCTCVKAMILLFFSLSCLVIFGACSFLPATKAAGGNTYYVSKNGNNNGGTSWTDAWNELNQINWSRVQPGDTILIDGGVSSMVYTTALSVGKSGVAGYPITIKRATSAGHNGTVVLYGGRSTPLPYCGQSTYTFQTQGVLTKGIDIGDNTYIVIDGSGWHGINVYGVNGSAVIFGSNSHNDALHGLQIYDDGTAGKRSDGLWYPSGPYLVNLHGYSHTFQDMDMHDGGEDAFQPTNVNSITIQLSWLHDSRPNPSHPGAAFNQCNHDDGMQIWTGSPVSNLTFDQDIIGPGHENGLILGNGQVKVSNVTITNSLFIDAGSNNIWGSPAANWTINHITSFAQNQDLILDGSGHSITNSIFYGGLLSLHGSVSHQASNCQWQTSGDVLSGKTVNPQFLSDLSVYPPHVSTDLRDSPTLSTLANLDFTLSSSSPCQGLGSSITSVNRFLQVVGGSSSSVLPQATSTLNPKSTQTPIALTPSGPTTRKSEQTPGEQGAASSQHVGVNPWVILGVLAILGVAAASLFLFIRRRRG